MNIRPFVEDDAPAVAALISADEERFYGRPGRLTGADGSSVKSIAIS